MFGLMHSGTFGEKQTKLELIPTVKHGGRVVRI